jgi:hypothetical protein
MSDRALGAASVIAIAIMLTGCQVSKSANPLSPSVAGPIPGVNITAPKIMVPATGSEIPVDQQPLTLTVGNASTTGVRPLTCVFDVGADSSFTNVVFTRSAVAPGDGGQTSLQLPDPLAAAGEYYWRAHAEDGANTGPYSAAAAFKVFVPVVIQAPAPIAPINNTVANSLRPSFVFTNAQKSGPAGPITYFGEVSDNQSFATKIVTWTGPEQGGQTSVSSPQDLPAARQLYWHVRASDPTVVGPWSTTQPFQTPAPLPPPPPPGGGGGGGGGGPAPGDAINLTQAAVYNSPTDIASWPVTAKITSLTMQPSGAPAGGLSFTFTAQNTWPNTPPPGFSGGIQYTVWAVVKINGQWSTSGFIEMWQGRPSTGAPILSDFPRNWAYDARWGPMAGYQPQVGEQMGFFLSAGDARGNGAPTSVRERTNVVVVALPAGDSGTFGF